LVPILHSKPESGQELVWSDCLPVDLGM